MRLRDGAPMLSGMNVAKIVTYHLLAERVRVTERMHYGEPCCEAERP